MSWNQVVRKVVDGEPVNAATLNPILASLVDREQYLYDRIGEYENKSVLLAYDLAVNQATPAVAGDVAYYKPGSGLTPAKVGFDGDFNGTHFTPLQSSFTVGIVKEVVGVDEGAVATVWLQGLITDIDLASMLVAEETEVQLGPLYLSKDQAGKLTASPGGMSVYVGFALSATQLLLHPNYDSLNQLFFNYKFDLLDRPAGIPELTDGVWTVPDVDLTKIGWIPASEAVTDKDLVPAGARFFYNMPADAHILGAGRDVSLSEREGNTAIALKRALPPYPEHFTSLFVNGVLQHAYDEDHPAGTYLLNNLGLWWFSDADESQPWASDLVTTAVVTFSTDLVQQVAHGLHDGDEVSFISTAGTMPANIAVNTIYRVVSAAADNFRLATVLEPSTPLVLGSLVGTPTVLLGWKNRRGSQAARPMLQLNFIKLNPDYKAATVSSLQPFDTNGPLKFVSADDRSTPQSTGDLLARLTVSNALTAESPATARAIKTVTFQNSTGTLQATYGPVVTGLNYTDGIVVTPGLDGVHTISLVNFKAA